MISSALGSYPRIGEGAQAQRLRRAIQRFQAGAVTREELRRVEDDVTAEVLAEQAAAGVDWVTDGLVRWEDGQTYFTDRLHGFRRGQLLRYFDTNGQGNTTGGCALPSGTQTCDASYVATLKFDTTLSALK